MLLAGTLVNVDLNFFFFHECAGEHCEQAFVDGDVLQTLLIPKGRQVSRDVL